MNEGFEYRERIDTEAEGEPLLTYLVRRHRHSSASQWKERIDAGRVLVDSSPGRPETALKRGQSLVWRRPPWIEPDAPLSFAVLHEDDDLLAVAKPAGLPTLPGGGFLQATLLHRVREYAPGVTPLHRLGRWTSGVVLFARTKESLANLTRQWMSRDVGKRYRALASGTPAGGELEIAAPIGPVPHALLGSVHGAAAAGKPARSLVVVLEQREGEFLCDVYIETGRPHQIRIHLAAAGHPLVGDPLYAAGGVPEPGCHALPGDAGYSLHAAELAFRHPRTGRRMIVTCNPPRPLRRESPGGEPVANRSVANPSLGRE